MSEGLEKEVIESHEQPLSHKKETALVDSAENFLEQYQKPLMYGGGAIVAVLVVVLFVVFKWLPDRNAKAQKEMFMSELAFAKDSFQVALNGNGTNKGFLEIGSKYSFTKAANLSHYYSGLCYLNLKKFDEAVKYLGKFSTSDPVLGSVKLSATGDAYAELGKYEDAAKYYEKAAAFSDNDIYAPYFLLKAGLVKERLKKFEDAKQTFEKLKNQYPNSDEGRDADKYIARVSAQL
jgi:tetratricopeptide (TPR) repeat protein